MIAYDQYIERSQDPEVELVSLDELRERSDIIVSCAALTDTSRGIIDAALIAQMKPGVIIVNVSRGGIVVEDALADALESGHVAYAALDVRSPEPPDPANDRLTGRGDVLLTQHNAASAVVRCDQERPDAMDDPIGDIIGDYRAFAALQRDRLAARGIDITPYALSHLAYRVADWDLYVHLRGQLERHATANLENVWNGRPISKILLAEPLDVLDGTTVSLIELIPPTHQRVYRMGLEHLGVVVGDDVDAFSREHRAALTGQQFQSLDNEPYYVLLEDFTHVKFYRRSLHDACVLDGARFEGFQHVDDWVPQRLVTATGPNPLPR